MSVPWQNHAPPAGWQGHWPPPANTAMPPGFPGPPPVPQGVPVPQSTWQAGFWQYNPTGVRGHNPFNTNHQSNAPAGGHGGPWAPSNHWAQAAAQQQQQGQNINPYKKVPRPPEAGYYDYKLVDNPLGLEGMEPRRCVYTVFAFFDEKVMIGYFVAVLLETKEIAMVLRHHGFGTLPPFVSPLSDP